jgi:hypothetical protein
MAPTPQIDDDQVSIASSGTLMMQNSGIIQHIALFPHDSHPVVTDPAIASGDDFPIIEFERSHQFMAPLPHRIAFPPTCQWGIAEFCPKTLYWPSPEDPFFILFQRNFLNYPACLHHETTGGYRRWIFCGYSRRFELVDFLEGDRRVDLYSGDDHSLEDVERNLGMLFFYFLEYLIDCFVDYDLHRYFYHHLLHYDADVLELPWYPETATVDVGGDMDAYLDRMSRPQGIIRWDMRTWWFTQQIPGYRFRWNEIDCDIWLALLDCSSQLFLRRNVPVQ